MLNSILINIISIFLSLAIFAGYYNASTSFDLMLFNNIISQYAIILIFVFIISFISLYLYDTDDRYNVRPKNKFSMSVFRLISKLIHITTIIIVCDSLFIDNFLGLEFHDNPFFTYIGIAVSSIAITLFISSKITLGKNYSPCYDQRKPKKIISSGLYKYVRHPIYSSNVLLLVGTFIISGSYLMLINILILSLFYIISAYREEKYLVNSFTYYKTYSKNTGMFIPRYKK